MKIEKGFKDRTEVEIKVGDIIEIDSHMFLLIYTTTGYSLQSFDGMSHWSSPISNHERLLQVIAEAKTKHQVTIYPAADFKLQLEECK